MMSYFIAENNEKITKTLWLYFGVIVLSNIFLKIICLDFSAFWYDEIISVQSASLDFGHIKHVSEWDKNPPFYYYCLSVWIKLYNDSEFCVRLLSVLFSSVSAGVLFLFANKHFNKTSAIIVSLLYISSDILFFYSHEARAYSLVVLLTLISSHIFLNFKEKSNFKYLLLLGLINFLLLYTHYIAGIVVFFQFILMLFCFNKAQKKHFLYSVLLTTTLVLLRFTKKQVLVIVGFNSSDSPFWLKTSDFNSLVEVLSKFLFNNTIIVPMILLMFIGIIFTIKHKNKKMYFTLIYTFLLGIVSILFIYSLGKFTPIFLDRYLIFTIPFIFLLVAYSLSFIKFQMITIIVSSLFAALFISKIDYKTPKAMDYRSVVSFVKQVQKNTDLVIVKTKDINALFGYYYEANYLKNLKTNLTYNENIIFCTSWNDMTKDLNSYSRVIVIDTFEDLNPNETDFSTKLSVIKQYHITSTFYKGVKISFYK